MGGKLHRGTHDGLVGLDDDLLWPRVAPGRVSITQRLPRSSQIVFRVADASMAHTIANAIRGRDANGVTPDADAAVDQAARGSGAALRGDLRARFESSLGADLGSVRVHTGAESAVAASAVGARAYTVGQDIHFADGQYRPDDPFGMHLLAHEVAHTVQQAGGATQRQHKLEVSAPADAAEVEADRAADAMVAGQRAEVSGGPTIAARDKDPNAANAAGPAGDAAKDADAKGFKPAKVVVNITEGKAGSIEYDAKTYLDLYKQVRAREDAKLEAGSCECSTIQQDYDPDAVSGQFINATFTGTITTKLPVWKQYADQTDADKKSFDGWLASIKAHEAAHAKVFLDGYATLKTAVKGPTAEECAAQFKKVDEQVDKDQKAFDAANQPASLPPPSGIEKVPSAGVPQPKAEAGADDGAAPAPVSPES